jgi:hypothetical protein
MAARYQHVTDALRSQVASQVGDLIWNPAADSDGRVTLLVRRNSLATLLAAADECITGHHRGTDPNPDLLAEIAELRTALAADAAPSGTSNETKTETTRRSQR